MAILKLLLASIAVSLLLVGVRSDAPIAGEVEASGSALRSELDGLRSKISALESSIEERIGEIKAKEESIAKLNAIIQQKLLSFSYLESEIESIHRDGDVDAKRMAGKADARVAELEKQIVKVRTDIEAQGKKRDALNIRAGEAEKKLRELNLRLETLQKTNEEQKLRIRKTQRALEEAEGELMKAQLEATSKFSELTRVHGAWLPPWLESHISHIQDVVMTHWNEHAKPAIIIVQQKASQKSYELQKWAVPHIHSAKTKWIPAAKEQLVTFKTNAVPYFRKMSSRTIEIYEASKLAIAPHIFKLQEVTYPYFQGARRFSKPYIDQAVVVTKPHVEKLQLVIMPYKKHGVRAYRKFLKTTKTYHGKVQNNIHEKLKKHELTKPYATKELAWFLASALLAFPVFFLYRVLAAAFSKKERKARRTPSASQTHRRPKRRHAGK